MQNQNPDANQILKSLIRKYLDDRDMATTTLAEESGIPYQTIRGWIRGDSTRLPRIDNVARLCSVFGLDFFKHFVVQYYFGHDRNQT